MEHTPPPFFKRGPAPLLRLMFFASLSFVLLASDAYFKYLDVLRQAVAVVVYPMQRLASAPGALATRVGNFFMTQAHLTDENSRLTSQNLQNAKQLLNYQALAAENAHLRKLLDARERLTTQSVMAEILYTARDPFSNKIVIDKGASNELRPGSAVVDDVGVIGQVTRVYPWLAEVSLIIDKDQAVPVQDLRSGFRGIVFGNGEAGTLDLRFTPVSADIQTGDTLVTSGIDGTYPPGLPVAVISNIERNAALPFAKITCMPLAGVNRNAQVLVLLAAREAPEKPPAPEAAPVKRKKSKKAGS
ncbi:MAG TPA: rod shape-determining protein MreC [Burkholderiales bacterium]|nr:rod shape-determining protein MreC [Burkholderiales bacterium]